MAEITKEVIKGYVDGRCECLSKANCDGCPYLDSSSCSASYNNSTEVAYLRHLYEKAYGEGVKETKTPDIKKFLYIEDGSVDTKKLIRDLRKTNPEIKVIIYKRDCDRPLLINVMED